MITLLRRLVPGLHASKAESAELRPVGDDHPKDAFFSRPLVVTALTTKVDDLTRDNEPPQVRVSFVVTIKDADGKRCPEMAVYARLVGPKRTATGMGHTSLLGQVTFRMSGPAGDYSCAIEDVAGGALGLDEDASILHTEIVATPA